jgi:hypothetical protein
MVVFVAARRRQKTRVNKAMTNREFVLHRNPNARLNIWGVPGGRQGFWVSGPGIETKVTYSEARAWELAVIEVSREAR